MTSDPTSDPIRARVLDCFAAAFPDLDREQLENARHGVLAEWDSLASLTLITLVEEEFDVALDDNAVDALTSVDSVVEHVRGLVA